LSDWAQVRTREMDWTGLKLMLEGIEPGRQRKRYRLPRSLQKTISNTSSNTSSEIQFSDGSSAAEEAPERDRDGLV
jgi:hypothetical protein